MVKGKIKTKEDWLREEGFDVEKKVTYIYFPIDSYEKKDELKNAGFRFNKILLWHSPVIPEGYADKVFEIAAADVAELVQWGGLYNPDAASKVRCCIEDRIPQSPSQWIGEVNKRLRDIPVTLIKHKVIESEFGGCNLYTFETNEGNILNWFTATEPDELIEGQRFLLTGTVKEHKEYKKTKQTILTRCKIKVEE